MLQQVSKIVQSSDIAQRLSKVNTSNITNNSSTKATSDNSFKSFKEYRKNARTYGPESSSLASKCHSTDLSKC